MKLRFALLFDGKTLERWHLRCLDHLEPFADLVSVIVAPDPPPATSKRGASILMRSYARRVRNRSALDVTKRFENVSRFRPENVAVSAEPSSFDFVLKLGCVKFPNTLLLPARLGFWCFEHERETDLLPFFDELYECESVTRAALLALIPRSDEAVILQEGYFRTELRSYIAHRDQLFDAIAEWPARVCRRFSAGAVAERASRGEDAMVTRRRPNRRLNLLRHSAEITRKRIEFAWQRLFCHPQWNIGVLNVTVGELLDAAYMDNRIEWFPLRGRENFLGDPFGVVHDGRLHVFCEYFGYREANGHIRTFDYSPAGFSSPQPAITQPVHLSYPFLVRDRDRMYCVPETSGLNEVALFRAEEFPLRWAKVAVLIEHFAGVDPTVFRHGGRWWLMCTEKGSQENVDLYVWHASDLFGPWIEHVRNPVKTDVRGARPGGAPFTHAGRLYRPAQDCSKRYGWRIVIQRITRLTPTDFAEEPVKVLEASAESPFPLGRHTLTPVGNVVLIDGHRETFAWPAFWFFVRICANDFWSRCASGYSTVGQKLSRSPEVKRNASTGICERRFR
jgi:hypothetical protein